jgi:hypothetical protein
VLHINRAYVNAFLKGNFAAARDDFLNASAIPGAPPYLSAGAEKYRSPDTDRRIALNVLRQMVATEKDPELKKRYQEKLRKYER